MFKFFEILASLSTQWAMPWFQKTYIHGPFLSLICGHSKVIFHMKIFTHHQNNITNQKPPLKFVSYVT